MRSLVVMVCLVQALAAQSLLQVAAFRTPASLDPHLSSDPALQIFFAQLYESPLECPADASGFIRIQPSICEMPQTSEDGLSVTLTVRPGCRFHDDPCFPGGRGREIGPEDVAWMFMRHADPFVKSAYWAQFLQGRIVGLDAWREQSARDKLADYDVNLVEGLKIQGRSLIIRLRERYPQLPALLTQTWASIIPREAVRRYGPDFGERHPVGSGPFRFVKKDTLGTYHFKRHDSYRISGKPLADEVRIAVMTSTEQQRKRFIEGALDLMELTPEDEKVFLTRGRLRKKWRRKGVSFSLGPCLEVSYICFNTRAKFLSDPRIRGAFALAIDRERVVRDLFGVRGVVADSPIPTGFPESRLVEDKKARYRKKNPRRARELLAEAGFPGGEGLPEFLLDSPGAQRSEATMKAVTGIIKDLARVGIRARFRESEFGEWFSWAKRSDFHAAWLAWYADYPDAENFLTLFYGAQSLDAHGFNYGRYVNPAYDRLYDEFWKLDPGPRRNELVKRMVAVLRRDHPWVFVAYSRPAWLMSKGTGGAYLHRLNWSLRDVSR